MFHSNKEWSINNCFAAHHETINDQNGKTNFKSNGKLYELKSIDGNYHYINVSSIDEWNAYLNVLGYSNHSFKQNKIYHKDLITLEILYRNFSDLTALLDTIENILWKFPLQNTISINKSPYGFSNSSCVHILFHTPREHDTCKVHEFAMLINTFKKHLYHLSDLEILSIWHQTYTFDKDIYYKFISNLNYDCPERPHKDKKNIFVSEDVRNYLIKCNYKTKSFSKLGSYSVFYERNYIFSSFEKLIKLY